MSDARCVRTIDQISSFLILFIINERNLEFDQFEHNKFSFLKSTVGSLDQSDKKKKKKLHIILQINLTHLLELCFFYSQQSEVIKAIQLITSSFSFWPNSYNLVTHPLHYRFSLVLEMQYYNKFFFPRKKG